MKRIIVKDWLKYKPYNTHTNIDVYYLKLANQVMKKIEYIYINDFRQMGCEELSKQFCCFLTCYFEDKISNVNIYNTFIKLHKKLYNKYLPFYEIGEEEEYFFEDIYVEDIQFLIWYFYNSIDVELFVRPTSNAIHIIAEKAFNLFNEQFEWAPENDSLKEIYSFKKLNRSGLEGDYYTVRECLYQFYFENYLFHPDIKVFLDAQMNEITDYIKNGNIDVPEEYFRQIVQGTINDFNIRTVHNKHSKLLNLTSSEWFAAFLGEDHFLYDSIKNIGKWYKGEFLYKGHNESYIFLEHIATDHKIELSRKSYEPIENFKEIDYIADLGIIKWNNEWWFSGNAAIGEFNADIILDNKNSIEKRVEFEEFLGKGVDEEFNEAYKKAFLKFNNGSPVAFINAVDVNSFVKNFVEFYTAEREKQTNSSLDESIQYAKSKGFFGDKGKEVNFQNDMDTAVVFVTEFGNIQIAPDVCSAFPVKENLFFEEANFENSVKILVHSPNISKDLVMYCFDNFKDQFSFLERDENRYILEDLDFIMRFRKGTNYYLKRSVTMI